MGGKVSVRRHQGEECMHKPLIGDLSAALRIQLGRVTIAFVAR
jgi:hypothetical protein